MKPPHPPLSFLIIGAGFSGAVLARELAETLDCRVEVWDERPHVAGNSHTERDPSTGVMVHQYGPHIFNTNNEKVWAYVQKFGAFEPFTNRVKASTARGVFPLPINLLTINHFFGKSFHPAEARAFVASLGDPSIIEPRNFEEQALKTIGRELYETFFKGYTIKQWGCNPSDLPADILKRLPIRFSYDDNYYSKKFQGIPRDGYTAVVEKILTHPAISLHLNKKYDPSEDTALFHRHTRVFFTGPLDAFFAYRHGRLGYRTVTFDRIATDAEDYQGTAVINYPDLSVGWTRVHEHKHFTPWETHKNTVAFREFSQETGPNDSPYYPKRLQHDLEMLSLYRQEALREETQRTYNTSFLGRLATYRYMDMETVIAEALAFSQTLATAIKNQSPPPIFPNEEAQGNGVP